MKIDEIIDSYYKRILQNKSQDEVNKIISEINSLTYANSGDEISYEDKVKIANGILLRHKSLGLIEERSIDFELNIPRYLVLEHSANDEVLTLCSIVHEEILKQKGNKK